MTRRSLVSVAVSLAVAACALAVSMQASKLTQASDGTRTSGSAGRVRDLLSLDIDPAALLPADDSSAGFDNVADVVGVSPVPLESDLSAADRIAALAVGSPKTPPSSEVYRVRQAAGQ